MSDERGFTLVELLVSMMLGMVVLGTVLSLITATGNGTKRVSDRIDAAQRGRTTIELMTQELRSSVCVPSGTPPVLVQPWVAASGNSVTWYSNLDADARTDSPESPDSDPTFDPQQRRLTYDPAERTIVEERWTLPVPVAAGTAPDVRRLLISHVDSVPGVPVFEYLGYPDGTASEPVPFTPAATQSDLARIVGVNVSFTARPTDPSLDGSTSAVMRSAVHARAVNRTTDPPAQPYPTYGCST